MARAEVQLGSRLSWIAADHHDTGHAHTHIILRGRRANGQDLVIPKDKLQAYLAATLHMPIGLETRAGSTGLPVFLARRYGFFGASIAEQPCLFMAAFETCEATPTEIAKQVALVAASFDGVVIYACAQMTSTLRARLVSLGVPFAVPGNQLYIPQLATDLREHFRSPDRGRGEFLSPAAQLVLFHYALRQPYDHATPSMLARDLKYSAMSIGRAFDEFAARGLVKIEKLGREKVLTFTDPPRDLLERSKAALRSPVRGVHAVRFKHLRPPMLLAGETALADLTNLATRALPTYAIDANEWQQFFERHGIEDYRYEYEAEAVIETWRYDPAVLSAGNAVDPLSLYARYWNDADERVSQAAQALLETCGW